MASLLSLVLLHMNARPVENDQAEQLVNKLAQRGAKTITTCYYHDDRATDIAWVEATVMHLHDEASRGIGRFPLQTEKLKSSGGYYESLGAPRIKMQSAPTRGTTGLLATTATATWKMAHAQAPLSAEKLLLLQNVAVELNAFW